MREREKCALKFCLQECTSVDCFEGNLAVSIKMLNVRSLWSSGFSSWFWPQGNSFTWVQRGKHCIYWSQWNIRCTISPISREWLKRPWCIQTTASVEPSERMWLLCVFWHRTFYSAKQANCLWAQKKHQNVYITCLHVYTFINKIKDTYTWGKREAS